MLWFRLGQMFRCHIQGLAVPGGTKVRWMLISLQVYKGFFVGTGGLRPLNGAR